MRHVSMKRGFTLIELIVVVVIVGVLACISFPIYTGMVRKAEGTEARTVIGDIRQRALAYYAEKNTCLGFDNSAAGIGADPDQVPYDCRSSHYFRYRITGVTSSSVFIVAYRCGAAGKGGDTGCEMYQLILISNFVNKTDIWQGNTDIY